MTKNITHAELTSAACDVQAMRIMEHKHGFELQVKLGSRFSYLATMRDKEKPRTFRSLDRLMTLIRSIYRYSGDVQLKTCAPFLDFYTQ